MQDKLMGISKEKQKILGLGAAVGLVNACGLLIYYELTKSIGCEGLVMVACSNSQIFSVLGIYFIGMLVGILLLRLIKIPYAIFISFFGFAEGYYLKELVPAIYSLIIIGFILSYALAYLIGGRIFGSSKLSLKQKIFLAAIVIVVTFIIVMPIGVYYDKWHLI